MVHPILIASWGGVASKALVRCFEPRRARWASSHTHRRMPPASVAAGTRVVYVFGDPRTCVLSFFQRRERRHAGHGFEGRAEDDDRPAPDWVVRHARNLEAGADAIDPGWNLADYLAAGADHLRLAGHWEAWTTAPRPYDRLLLRHETMWSHLPALFDFMGADRAGISDFPPRRERRADLATLSPEVRDALERLYGDLAARVAAAPDVRVVGAS